MPVLVTAEVPGQTAEGYDAMLGHTRIVGEPGKRLDLPGR
jgi:hypothetical protein